MKIYALPSSTSLGSVMVSTRDSCARGPGIDSAAGSGFCFVLQLRVFFFFQSAAFFRFFTCDFGQLLVRLA